MTRQPFSHSFQSEYISAQHLNLLPVDLFNHVQAGRLHPLDEYTGQAIPRPDVLRITKKLKKITDTMAGLPLSPEQYDNLLNRSAAILERARLKKQRQVNVSKDEHFVLTCITKGEALYKKLKAITDIYDWTTYKTQDDPRPDFDILQNALFRKSEVDQLSITDGGKSPAKENAPNPQNEPATKEQVENYLQRNGKYWAIKFQDEYNTHFDHRDGLFYIAHILRSKPGENISDRHLISLAKIKLQADSNEKMAISNNLSDQMEYQESHDQKAHCKYLARYNQLKIDLESAESDLERNEIKKEMTAMLPFLKQRNIAGQEEKRAQANITKRLEVAYRALESEGMKKLANHLRQCITTTNYSRVYTGGIVWEIFL
jgi:hypothetical protein